MKWDAKTIVAVTGLVSVLMGGVELRVAVNKLDDKLSRLDDRMGRVERELSPRAVAENDHE